MTKPGEPSAVPGDGTEPLPGVDPRALTEFLDTYIASRAAQVKKPSGFRRASLWTLSVIVGALLLHNVIPAINRAVAAARCAVKYEMSPVHYDPPLRTWTPYGATTVRYEIPSKALVIQPQLLTTDEWFGASLSFAKTCDYTLSFRASLVAPLLRANNGEGYAIGARGKVVNGWPYAATVQFDPPFGGLRTVELPFGANKAGYNAEQFNNVTTSNAYHRWDATVNGDMMYLSLDGRVYPPVSLNTGHGLDIIIRVWNGQLTIQDVVITRQPNSFAKVINHVLGFFHSL